MPPMPPPHENVDERGFDRDGYYQYNAEADTLEKCKEFYERDLARIEKTEASCLADGYREESPDGPMQRWRRWDVSTPARALFSLRVVRRGVFERCVQSGLKREEIAQFLYLNRSRDRVSEIELARLIEALVDVKAPPHQSESGCLIASQLWLWVFVKGAHEEAMRLIAEREANG